MDHVETIARHVGPRGEVVLRRRIADEPGLAADETLELVVDGAFAMDSTAPFTEQALGDIALATRSDRAPTCVLVGGLGLGYTVREILEAADLDGTDILVDVVEIESCLIGWARAGVTSTLARVAADRRVRLHAADIASVLGPGLRNGPAGPWDAILLDVDNGPDFLIHTSNARLYAETGLRAAYAHLSPGGTLAIWCQGESDALLEALRHIDPAPQVNLFSIERGQRTFEYAIYAISRPDTPRTSRTAP